MLNERIKMAESIDTVHTHTHTIFLQTELVDSLERELHFSEIEYSFIKYRLKKIVIKICFNTGFYCCLFLCFVINFKNIK